VFYCKLSKTTNQSQRGGKIRMIIETGRWIVVWGVNCGVGKVTNTNLSAGKITVIFSSLYNPRQKVNTKMIGISEVGRILTSQTVIQKCENSFQKELAQEVKKHFEALAENGSRIKEIREIANGIIVAIDKLDDTFIFYFLHSLISFRTDRTAQLWSANDQRGRPDRCSKEVMGFACGVNKPKSWDEVIREAECRLIGINGEAINWFSEPCKL